ncbi:MAG: pyruvate:ferredoxin (flavodoxin) oxidoreductase [Oscillospiraceae bacterium]|nr:pyruvate:ferredoxin (flavodoxin) oxidoreductase [Oscillospiraceae bacterium]
MARKMKTMDGNNAAAHVSYAFTDLAAIYPITPSSVMAVHVDEWSAKGQKNIFGNEVKVVEMQSEAGAAGAVHGSLAAGALTTTFTASQGLLLMIPNMYKIAGELLPCVIDVSARAVASHALSIFGDHSDVMACRQTGFAMLAEGSVQEVMDLTAVAHLSAIKGRVPFLNFFDGFRTSHEIQKVAVWDYEDLKGMCDMDAVEAFRSAALNPEHPIMRGSAQNPDIFFQAREASNKFYNELPDVVEDYMGQVNKKLGTDYSLFNYYGAADAETVLVAMGSVCETIDETIDYLNAAGGKYGVVKVHLYRPFSAKHLLAALPKTVKNIAVLDRTKEPGALGEPLYLDVVAALKNTSLDGARIVSGRYGLGSKDTTPAQIIAAFRNAEAAQPKKLFTLGIEDDVTHLSLALGENPDTTPAGTTCCKFWGLGSDGTVGANKNSIKIIGDHTDMYAQAYFAYDSKKSGGVTISHLRFGKTPIRSTYLINKANFVACHNPAYVGKFDMVEDLKKGGTFLLNCQWDLAELEEHLTAKDKKYIADNDIQLYTIDAIAIDKKLGLRGKYNTVLQSAFFKLANIIPEADAIKYMKDAATATYGRKGEEIVKMNHDAIDAGADAVVKIDVPASWKSASGSAAAAKATGDRKDLVDFVNDILIPCNLQHGDELPVSTFTDREDGHMPQGSAAYEKRGVAVNVPTWNPENCIQCNFCAYVCPHAVIRPVAMTAEELAKAPKGTKAGDMLGIPGMKMTMTVSVLDCTGCGSCVSVCPGKQGNKALSMQPLENQTEQQDVFAYGQTIGEKPEVAAKFSDKTVKGSQYKQPLLEFSGACGGCGETPYAKLVTQLFGDRMYIANATGCSSIWGGSAPATPYTVNKDGRGPAWANSLFEDNAEYGFGMYLAQDTLRKQAIEDVRRMAAATDNAERKAAAEEYLSSLDDGAANRVSADKLIATLGDGSGCENCHKVYMKRDYLAKKSVWAFGGDGWSYDIGFGGLDHVLASGEDINVLVFNTEVYSNTGGQSSKATPTGAVAQFAAAGKEQKQKDLAAIAMSYGYVYVAQIAMGADYNQTLKAIHEAESYHGPSLIIAYAPCINHGIKGGLVNAQTEIKRAVECGYWNTFRYDPRRKAEGKNPFQLDCKAPTGDFTAFIKNEVRYSSLERTFPERATTLFEKAIENAKDKYDQLVEKANEE